MPNYCENQLKVEGKVDEVQRFIDFVKSDNFVFDFGKVSPYPYEYSRIICIKCDKDYTSGGVGEFGCPKVSQCESCGGHVKDGFNRGGYDWCIKYWGTKWNSLEVEVKKTKKGVKISFQTAWSPPLPIIKLLGIGFPTLRFTLKYWEGGVGFQGSYEMFNKELVLATEKAYHGKRGG